MPIQIEVFTETKPKHITRQLLKYADLIPGEIDAETKRVAYGIRDEAKTYDAPPVPGHRRTGHMSRQTVSLREPGVRYGSWLTEMRADYSKWVRGTTEGKMQAWMHRGRWKKFSTIVRKWREGHLKNLRAALKRAKQKAGFGA